MKPNYITGPSAGGDATGSAAWWNCLPFVWLSRAYKVEEFYACGLAGMTRDQCAEEIGTTAAAVHHVLRESPGHLAAYEAGWLDWERESLRRTEVAQSRLAEGFVQRVRKGKVEKGVLTHYTEEEYVPPSAAAQSFRLERRDRERFGKDVRPEEPMVGRAVLDRVSLYLIEKGLGAVQGLPQAPDTGAPRE